MISFKIEGLDDLIKNFENVDVKKEFVDASNVSVAEVQKIAMIEVPVRTSQLQKSHILSPATIHTAQAEVYTDKEYAVPVHEGHRLVAWGRDTGRKIPPNPWFKRAVEKSMGKIDSVFDKASDNVARQLTK